MQVAAPDATRHVARDMSRLGPVLTTLAIAVTALLLASCRTTTTVPAPAPTPPPGPLILISIDGFRWDYLQLHDAPTLRALAAQGTRATRMRPSFPSKTFPNHYTLVTGLHPQNHGIVANWFFEPTTGDKFTMQRMETFWWDAGEPIWITAEKQGVRSACFFWPGSETELQGRRPSLWQPFQHAMPPMERVDGLLRWLALSEGERPALFTLYFDHVDTIGHAHGPTAPETAAAVKLADDAIARLLAGLEKLGLRDRTNLVLVADHGMSENGPERVIFLDDLMDLKQVRVESTGPNGGVRPLAGIDVRAFADAIRAKAPPQLKVYLREDVPAHLHYNRGERIPPIVLIADDHWSIEERRGWPHRRLTYSKATHGWDPTHENMGALFLAHGPAFRRGATIPVFDNIHVYELLCAALKITPAKNDGDDRLARAVLAPR